MENKMAESRIVVRGGAFSRRLKSPLLKKKNKKAFTLAEVLVTLTIIGVVASITVPTLSHNATKHATINILKTTYSILSQAIQSAQRENGNISEWLSDNELGTKEGTIIVAENLKPFFKISVDCKTKDEKNECVKKDPYLRLNGNAHDIDYASNELYYKLRLNNGTSVWWRTSLGEEIASGDYLYVFVDTNGIAKPNKWGKDLFMFTYNNEKLIPAGSPNGYYNYERECIAKNSTGIGCAYYVLTTDKMDY